MGENGFKQKHAWLTNIEFSERNTIDEEKICGLKQSDILSNSSEFQKSNADERKRKLGKTSGVLRGQQQGSGGQLNEEE